MEYKGKRVVITGAAGIFGTSIAKAFAREGAALCLSDIRKDDLTSLLRDPVFQNVDVITHQTELRDSSSLSSLAGLIEKEWGAPDILINCAGIYPSSLLLETDRDDWDKVLDINVSAPFELTKLLCKLMIQHDVKGSIVNMSSGSASRPRMGAGHYAVSKAGVQMLTRAYALELAQYNIRVNAVSPGFAPGSKVSPLSENYIEAITKGIPLGRTTGPEDVPNAILFLCSEKSSYITGTTLDVDGGSGAGNYSLPMSKPESL